MILFYKKLVSSLCFTGKLTFPHSKISGATFSLVKYLYIKLIKSATLIHTHYVCIKPIYKRTKTSSITCPMHIGKRLHQGEINNAVEPWAIYATIFKFACYREWICFGPPISPDLTASFFY